jgi:hypothetical protein
MCAAIVVVAIVATALVIWLTIAVAIARVETGVTRGTLRRAIRRVGRADTPKTSSSNIGRIREIAVCPTAARCTTRTLQLPSTRVVRQWPG